MGKEIVKSDIIDEGSTNLTPIELMLQVDENGETTARKLYEFLQLAPQHFARWAKTNILENPFAIENADYLRVTIDGETPTGGKIQREDYKLTASFAKKLCMVSQSERGEQARNYFLKVEEKLKQKINTNVLVLPQDYESALEALLKQVKENNKLLKEVEESKPKVEMYEKLMNGKNALEMNEVAKVFEIGRNKLFRKLRGYGILMKNNVPYQKYMEQQYFRVIFIPIQQGETIENIPKTLVTAKGLEFIHKKLKLEIKQLQ